MPPRAVVPKRMCCLLKDISFYPQKMQLDPRPHLPVSPPYLQEGAECGIGGVVGDEEPHVFVADLHRRRAVHPGHGGDSGKVRWC